MSLVRGASRSAVLVDHRAVAIKGKAPSAPPRWESMARMPGWGMSAGQAADPRPPPSWLRARRSRPWLRLFDPLVM
jgi:hypothetical protein